jgi:putative oxidoreductase
MSEKRINISLLLIRILVGTIFLSEGIQKFLFPNELGVGRFIKIGLPAPDFLGYFVPCFEIACGLLVLSGLFTRIASIPLLVIMIMAIASTKIPILLNAGFWKMAHEARTDWAMLIVSLVLLLLGAGKYSLDSYLSKKAGKKY